MEGLFHLRSSGNRQTEKDMPWFGEKKKVSGVFPDRVSKGITLRLLDLMNASCFIWIFSINFNDHIVGVGSLIGWQVLNSFVIVSEEVGS